MSSSYKLTFFNTRGRAEFIRMLFAQVGVEYEDIRIEKDEWAILKPNTPFGKVPILEIDGTVISESRAIARYVAREHGLAGNDNLEAAKCDMLVDAYSDLIGNFTVCCLETDKTKRVELYNTFAAETVPSFLACLNRILEKNHGGVGFLVGDQLTWTDIFMANGLNRIYFLGTTFVCKVLKRCIPDNGFPLLKDYPLINAFIERILALPNIKAWIVKRPVTEN